MPKSLSAKIRIVDKAAKVFYKHGYRATGVDRVAKEAGITKATLYHHFHSKDDLIEESLRYLSKFHQENYVKAWSKKNLSAQKKLTVLFDEMHASFKSPDNYGCPFINAAGEYTDMNSPVRKICKDHYGFLVSNLAQFAREAGLKSPRQAAEKIVGCIAGAYSAWVVGGFQDAALLGKKSAELIIEAHSP